MSSRYESTARKKLLLKESHYKYQFVAFLNGPSNFFPKAILVKEKQGHYFGRVTICRLPQIMQETENIFKKVRWD